MVEQERERSAEREVAESKRSGDRLLHKFERGAAFSPVTLRTHALIQTDTQMNRQLLIGYTVSSANFTYYSVSQKHPQYF